MSVLREARERLYHLDSEMYLSDYELLSLIFNCTLTTDRVLKHVDGDLAKLNRNINIPNITAPQKARLLAAIQFGRRVQMAKHDRKQIEGVTGAAEILMALLTHEQEQLRVLCLNNKHYILKEELIYQGTTNSIEVKNKEIFRLAVRLNASAIVAGHNHPSGDPAPSPEDRDFTRKLVRAGKLLHIDVLDHIIVGRGQYYSLREKAGELFR
jgi:DNA repair protein RadC